jgi:uncharacterized protein
MMSFVLNHHVERRLGAKVRALLDDEPVIALQGPRSVGKSTLLREIAHARSREVIDLDDLGTRSAVVADPALFAAGPSPVLIDEFQHAPLVLDAIKAELNRDFRPGRFVLTGSTSYESLPLAAQSLTGRLHVVTVWPLSQGELRGVRETFSETLLDDPSRLVTPKRSNTTREDYIERIVGGGMPIPLSREPGGRRARWFEDYLARVLERDVLDISRVRQRDRLPVLLSRLAGQGAQVLNLSRAARDARLETWTAEAYLRLLEAVFLVYRLPAWGTTLRARAVAKPKIHLVDTGVAAHMLRLNGANLARRTPSAITELGHLTESFAVTEILKQISHLDQIVHAGHWRTHDGDEVNLVLERADGAVVGVEIKSASRVRDGDDGGLRKLRDTLGGVFVGGVILYTGDHAYRLADRLYALPLDRLWTA